MKLALGLTFGGMTQVRPPPGMAAGQTIAVTPTLVDGVAAGLVAVVHADFVNEAYYVNGAAVGFADVVMEDLANWGSWTPARTSSGVQGGPVVTPAAYGSTLSEGTVVLEGELIDNGWTLDFYQTPTYDPNYQMAFLRNDPKFYNASTPLITKADLAIGIHRVAFTIAGGNVSMSIDGDAVETAALPGPATFNLLAFSIADSYLRSFTIYEPQDDADLPALSAL